VTLIRGNWNAREGIAPTSHILQGAIVLGVVFAYLTHLGCDKLISGISHSVQVAVLIQMGEATSTRYTLSLYLGWRFIRA
jgi:hypothetical protein